MKSRNVLKRMIALVLVLAMLPFIQMDTAFAADGNTKNVTIHVRYGQTEARTLLGMINSLRSNSNDAWYWEQGNANRKQCTNLKQYVYDYGLEEVAMKRAAEIALVYSHGRPTNKNYWTAFDDCGISSAGKCSAENIAVGFNSATAVHTAWTEANERYEGQGHRRNLLSDVYTAVGVGHVKYNNRDYWVEIFSNQSPRTTATTANDSDTMVYGIEIDAGKIQADKIDTTAVGNNISLAAGSTRDLSGIFESIKINEHFKGSLAEEYCPLRQNITMSVANTGIATINGNTLTGVSNGTTTLTVQCTLGGPSVSIPVTVGQGGSVQNPNTNMNLQNAAVDSIPDQRYTGYALTPAVTVRMNNIVLRQNTDYIVDYSNNTNVGTAIVTITGIGQYTGTRTANFLIYGQSIADATIDYIPDQRYNGTQIRPAVTVRMGSVVLVENRDYRLTYNNNINAGMATVTVTGMGGYSGSKTAAFKITDTDISHSAVTVTSKLTYTGNELYPSVQVMLNDIILNQNTDYVVYYENNIFPGKAKVTITGIGNYTGTKSKTFVIVPKKEKINSAKAAKSRKVSIKWNEDEYASGYVLYCSSTGANSGFKKIASFTKPSRTSYQSSAMRRGTYYYKVRSYIVVNGKKYYGAYSKVKTVRVK